MLRYLQHEEIDKSKWDNCVLNAHNSLIYAHSFYLDNCTNKKWDALVLGDYETIMPLTFREKYFIKYLYQPAFLQQAGIFSIKKLNQSTINIFIDKIKINFKFAEINLNYLNNYNVVDTEIILKKNFLLPLNEEYKIIRSAFKKTFLRNIKYANRDNFEYKETNDFSTIINLYSEIYGSRISSVKQEDFASLKLNCEHLQKTNNLIVRNAILNNKIYASIILLKDKNRLYNIAPLVTQEGKKLRANFFLFDKIIEEFSNKKLVLDFEGSDIKGIANFYKSMTDISEDYSSIKYNNLPKLLKIFKK